VGVGGRCDEHRVDPAVGEDRLDGGGGHRADPTAAEQAEANHRPTPRAPPDPGFGPACAGSTAVDNANSKSLRRQRGLAEAGAAHTQPPSTT
jgi:hypothetical protein